MKRLLLSLVILSVAFSGYGQKKFTPLTSVEIEHPNTFLTSVDLSEFTQLTPEKIYMRTFHSSDSVLVVLGVSEQMLQLKLLTQGVKLHFDYTGKGNTRYTVEFPTISQDELKALDAHLKSQNLLSGDEEKLEVKQIVGRIGMVGAAFYDKREELDFSPAQTRISINLSDIVFFFCVVSKEQIGGKAGSDKMLSIGFTNEFIMKEDPSNQMAGGLRGGIHVRGYVPQSYGNHPMFRPIKLWAKASYK